jgi:hypothetical protein
MSSTANDDVKQALSSAPDIAPKPLGAAEPPSRRAVPVAEPIFAPLPTVAGGWACVACDAPLHFATWSPKGQGRAPSRHSREPIAVRARGGHVAAVGDRGEEGRWLGLVST